MWRTKDEPENCYKTREQNPKTLLKINYSRTELIEYENEHNIYSEGHKTKETNYAKLTLTKHQAKARINPNSGAYNLFSCEAERVDDQWTTHEVILEAELNLTYREMKELSKKI